MAPRDLYRVLVSSRRFAYHILTRERFATIAEGDRALRSRNELGTAALNYALPKLVQLRDEIHPKAGVIPNEGVPFYFTPRSPMFCRLVSSMQLGAEDIVAIGVDVERCKLRHQNWLFSSNPVHPDAQYLGSCDERELLAWDVLERWDWRTGIEEQDMRSAFSRQAELLLSPPVMFDEVDHLVVDNGRTPPDHLLSSFRVIQIPGIFAP